MAKNSPPKFRNPISLSGRSADNVGMETKQRFSRKALLAQLRSLSTDDIASMAGEIGRKSPIGPRDDRTPADPDEEEVIPGIALVIEPGEFAY